MLNVHDQAGVLHIEMEHGKVNALDLDLLHALVDAFHTAPLDRPIVLTGAGRAFSAGVDLRRIIDGGTTYTTDFLHTLSECFLAVFDHPGPVVAAIGGAAIAGGCVIAAACDHRIISRGPVGLTELAVGVPFPTSALEIIRGLVGSKSHDLVLGARTLDADEALAIGLVDEVVTDADLLARAFERALTSGGLPPGVFAFTKRQLQAPVRERIRARAADDDAEVQRLWASDGARDAIQRFMSGLARR